MGVSLAPLVQKVELVPRWQPLWKPWLLVFIFVTFKHSALQTQFSHIWLALLKDVFSSKLDWLRDRCGPYNKKDACPAELTFRLGQKKSTDFLISVWRWSLPSMSWHMLYVAHSSCSLCPLRNNRSTVVKWQCRVQAVKMRSSLCRLLSSLVAWNKYQIRHRYVYFIISGSDFRIFGSNTFRFF